MAVCPFASQSYRYDKSFSGQVYRGGPNKGVLHTTEGGSAVPGYRGGAVAPHFTVVPYPATKTVKIFQHFDTDRPSRALEDRAGGVQTNNDGVIQIELAGTCVKGGPGLFWPEAPEWALEPVRKLIRWINADRGIPLVGPPRGWMDYPASYGSTRVRMSQREWDDFAGWCGHQHVPENDHGDPGDLTNLIASLTEDDVTPQDKKDIAYEVWRYTYDGRQALSYLVTDDTNSRAARAAAEQALAQATALSAAVEAVSKAAGVDPAEIAGIVDKAVRDRLAKIAVVDKPEV